MNNYPGIWKTNINSDSTTLFEEISRANLPEFQKVYSKNNDWGGIVLFDGKEKNLLSKLPYLQQILNQIGNNSVIGVTMFNLKPKSLLHRHRDMNGNIIFNVLRIHLPIKTNPLAQMEVNYHWYYLEPNQAWILDTAAPHALKNDSEDNRIHIVVDIKKSAETEHFFPPKNMAYYVHITKFVSIASFLLVKDIFKNPSSIPKRISRSLSLIFKR